MPTSADECFRDDLDPSQHFGAGRDRRCRFRRIFGKNGGEPAIQAIIDDDGDVYAAFAKLPDASSRIFTAWRPDSIQMKLGAILEFIAIDQPAFVVAWPTLVEHVVWPALWPKACSRRYR
jgi:hypothetical protein